MPAVISTPPPSRLLATSCSYWPRNRKPWERTVAFLSPILFVIQALYPSLMTNKIGDKKATVRSHGFRFRGQYEQEVQADLDMGGAEITAGIPGENAHHKTV